MRKTEEDTKRPSQYAFLDQLIRDAGWNSVYSLSKAEEYKREAKAGNLQIQGLSDARADPPRGFQRTVLGPSGNESKRLWNSLSVACATYLAVRS